MRGLLVRLQSGVDLASLFERWWLKDLCLLSYSRATFDAEFARLESAIAETVKTGRNADALLDPLLEPYRQVERKLRLARIAGVSLILSTVFVSWIALLIDPHMRSFGFWVKLVLNAGLTFGAATVVREIVSQLEDHFFSVGQAPLKLAAKLVQNNAPCSPALRREIATMVVKFALPSLWAAALLRKIEYWEPVVDRVVLELLRSSDARTAVRAIRLARALHLLEPKVVSALTNLFRSDANLLVRCAAAETIGDYASRHLRARDALAGGLSDRQWMIRKYSLAGLGATMLRDRALINRVLKALHDEDERVARAAARTLALATPSDPQVLGSLLEQLRDEHDTIRRRAGHALALISRSHPAVLRDLVKTAADRDPRARRSALLTLGECVDGGAVATHAVAERLIDIDHDVREAAREALRRLAHRDSIALAVLDRMLVSAPRPLKYAIVESLDALAECDLRAVTTAGRLLDDEDWRIRSAALELISRHGADLRLELPSLFCRALRDEHPKVRETAARAISAHRLVDDIHLATEPLLDDPDAEIRRIATKVLGEIALWTPTSELLLTLIGCHSDEDWQIRESALDTFRKLGRSEQSTVALAMALDSHVSRLREAAARLAGRLQLNDDRLAKRLSVMVQCDHDPNVRRAALAGLCQMQRPQDALSQALLAALQDPDPSVRADAISLAGSAQFRDRKIKRLLKQIARSDEIAGLNQRAAELLSAKPSQIHRQK